MLFVVKKQFFFLIAISLKDFYDAKYWTIESLGSQVFTFYELCVFKVKFYSNMALRKHAIIVFVYVPLFLFRAEMKKKKWENCFVKNRGNQKNHKH